MENLIFAYVALLLIAGLASTRLMKVLKLPNVTGYIITGIIMGPFVFGALVNNFGIGYDHIKESYVYDFVSRISWVSSIALGFIAFSIGTSFHRSTLKSVGKKVIVITLFEAIMASLVVFLALMVAHFIFPDAIPWPLVLTLSAIASATAPAATLMVIRQYNAKGPLVNTLLPVVALDDAVALILFAVLFQIANSIGNGAEFNIYAMFIKPILEILISLGIGLALGFLISFMNRFFKSRNNRLVWCIVTVFASVGLYHLFHLDFMGGFDLSSLLICMMAGAIYTNMREDAGRTLDVVDRFTSPIFMMFFIISGASLDLTIFASSNGLIVLAIAGVYILSRALGKWGGAFTGAALTRSEPVVRKYLGFALVPQAGVAIGLATTASASFSGNEKTALVGSLIIAVILFSTLVYELVGPLLSKFALKKAGEIQ